MTNKEEKIFHCEPTTDYTDCSYTLPGWCYGNASTRKRLNAEISVFFWEIPQNWKMLRDFRIFLRRFLIFKVEVFPLFFWGVSVFFWGVSVFWKKFYNFNLLRRFLFFLRRFLFFLRRFRFLKKVLKLYFVEAFPLFFEVFPFFFEAFPFFEKTFKTLFCWGVSSFFEAFPFFEKSF